MKRTVFSIFLKVLLGVFWIHGEGAFGQTPVKLKWAAVMASPGVSPSGDIAKSFQEEVTNRTKGAITFESFWGASMGAPAEHIEMLKNNVVQITQTHQWYTPTKMPFGDFEFVFPFGPTDYVSSGENRLTKKDWKGNLWA
ncbi:MAG: hypothetical protein FJ117_03705 [Deltaproteobacteria bacterium]|nr:hypothetical protein [Deltaproteobacteria bacterium]